MSTTLSAHPLCEETTMDGNLDKHNYTHGKSAMYKYGGCREDCCRIPHDRQQRRRRKLATRGIPMKLTEKEARSLKWELDQLMARGWLRHEMAVESGVSDTPLKRLYRQPMGTVTRESAVMLQRFVTYVREKNIPSQAEVKLQATNRIKILRETGWTSPEVARVAQLREATIRSVARGAGGLHIDSAKAINECWENGLFAAPAKRRKRNDA